jgi:hypothetical protein
MNPVCRLIRNWRRWMIFMTTAARREISGKNVTMLSSVGWDWIPEVRDRNIGIWQPVYLRTSGQVVIGRPQVITELPGIARYGHRKDLPAPVSYITRVAMAQKGKLWVTISPENFSGAAAISFSRDASVGAMGVEASIDLTSENTKELVIRQPHLWWPNGYGNPDLYRMQLQYDRWKIGYRKTHPLSLESVRSPPRP